MIFLSDAAGVITAAIPEPINQGSIGVNRIVLIAPFPSTSVVSATFTLPNGIKIYPRYVGKEQEDNYQYLMGVVGAFRDKGLTIDGVTVNAWQLTLDKAITSIAGNVTVQFLVTSINGTLTTTSATLTINRGNAYISPSVAPSQFDLIQEYVAAANNASALALNDAIRAETAANRASPWVLVITPQNVNDVFADWTRRKVASSILFFNIDFSKLVTGDDAFLVFDDSTRKLEFRGCTFEDEQGNPIKLSLYYSGSQCSIEGAKGDELVIQGFTDVIYCRANIIKDCKYVTACDANSFEDCKCVTDSTGSAFTNCIFVDPFTVKGFVPATDNGKVPTLSQGGGYVPKQFPANIVLAVDEEYKVTATLKDVNDGVISTATIDLPLESVVVKATVSEEDGQKFLILKLQNGEETKIPLDDIFQGLATEAWVNEKISVVNTTIDGIGTRVTALEDGLEASETEIDELKRSKLNSAGLTHSYNEDGCRVSLDVGVGGVVLSSLQSQGKIKIGGYDGVDQISITYDEIAGIPYDDIAKKTEIAPLSEDISNLETQNTILKKRVDNIEGAAIDFVADSTEASTKTVPTDALPYAKIMKIGGKTVVEDVPFEGFILKSAPVSELTSYSSDGELLDTFTVPEAVRPVNGINANACDYIAWEADGTRKKYVCIAIVDASSLTWYYDSSTNVFYTASLNNEKAFGSTNVLCTRYVTATVSWANMNAMIAGASSDSVLRIKDTMYGSDLTSFRNSLAGVQIAYEMKTPTVTDITDILTADNWINVQGDGEIITNNGGKGAPTTTIYYATEKTGG